MNIPLYIYIIAMALTTYLVRMLPFVLIRQKITSPFLRSFFHYVPYAVLGAMTVPYIFYSTADPISSAAAFICAVLLAWKKLPLIAVAGAACAAAFITSILV